MKALIGYTGFVGRILKAQTSFDAFYNSKNSAEMRGKRFDMVICAGVQAKKWLANKEPEKDLAGIKNLIENLEQVKANQFILISTVDVFDRISGVNEDHHIDISRLQPYGKNRLYFEDFVNNRFQNVTIVRLPALFGPGLQKNVIFDLIHNQMLDYTHPDSEFQFYNMSRLWNDIQTAVRNNIQLITFATEPLRAGDIAKKALGIDLHPGKDARPVYYNITSKYAKLYGGTDGYLYHKYRIINELIAFIHKEKLS